MKPAFIPVFVLAFAAFASIPAAQAQSPVPQTLCGKRTEIIRQLGEKYGETRRSLGLSQGRGVVELFASEETGSWTILLTSPQGTTCMMAAGEAFQVEPAGALGEAT